MCSGIDQKASIREDFDPMGFSVLREKDND